MKKITYLFFFFIIILTPSCLNEEDDIFEDSAANRMSKALMEYKEILQNSHYGWVLDYYPGYEQEYGPYNLFARFIDGEVKISAEERIAGVQAGNEVSSFYELIADHGPVLTFNTYNTILHSFSNPSSSSASGQMGDYEFVFMDVQADTLFMRGKKYGSNMLMVKLEGPSYDYLEKKNLMKEIITETPRLKMVADGQNIRINLESKFLYYTLINEDGEEEEYEVAFVYDSEGMRLYRPITVNGIDVQFFKMDIAADRLESLDKKVTIPAPGALEEFCNTPSQWYFDFNISGSTRNGDMSEDVLKKLIEINDANQQKLVENITALYLGKSLIVTDRNAQAFVFSSLRYSTTNSSFRYTMLPDYRGDNRVKIELDSRGTNRDAYSHFLPFLEYIEENSPYDIVFDNAKSPLSVKFNSVNNPDVWFNLFK